MGQLQPCCADESNRVIREEDQDPDRPNIEVQRCQECNRRHITFNVEAGEIGLHGKGI